MLQQIKVCAVTAFKAIEINFATGLNVITGENGSGKPHLLKIAYSVIAAAFHPELREAPEKLLSQLRVDTSSKLVNVLRPDSLGRLAQRKKGRAHSEIVLTFGDKRDDCSLTFFTSSAEVAFDKVPQRWQPKAPVFFPTRELLTLYPNFVSFYDGLQPVCVRTAAIRHRYCWPSGKMICGATITLYGKLSEWFRTSGTSF